MKKRTKLKLLRVAHHLTQEQMAKRLNVSRNTYVSIENGARNGTYSFWERVQGTFAIPSEDMWQLQRLDGE